MVDLWVLVVQAVLDNDDFYVKLAKAIADTAEAEGISLVLDKKKVQIWYYVDEVDITDAVIKAMDRLYG